jgi:O-antigen/teichoic acid export membrane protein
VATLPLALLAAAFLLVRSAFPWGRVDWAILRSFLWYSGWAMVSVVAVSVHSRLDVLMLGWIEGPEAAGIYAAAFGLAVSLELFAGALLTVFLPKVASASGRGFDLLCHRYRVTVLPILLGVSGLVVPLAHHVMLLAYGPSYGGSAIVFQVLVMGLMLPHFVMPQILLIWVHRPRTGALMDLLALPAIYAGNLLWIPAYGPLGAALNVLVVRAAIVVAVLVLARRLSRGSPDPGSRPLQARAGEDGAQAVAGAATARTLSAPLLPSTCAEQGPRGRGGL